MNDEPSILMREPAVDTALVGDLADVIRRFVVLPFDAAADVLALFVLHTWVFDSARITPYIYIHSPEKRAGKTTLLEVLEMFVRDPLRATNTTTSALFRAIDTMVPTFMLDEADAYWSGTRNEPMRSLLNGGNKQGGYILRILQQAPKKYSTFCPKVLAGIWNGFIPDTIADRAIPIELRRKAPGQEVERFHALDVSGSMEIEALRLRIDAFVANHSFDVAIQRPEPMLALNDRQSEICEPLLQIAAVLELEEAARASLEEMFLAVEEAPDPAKVLLRGCKAAFGDADRITSEALVERLGAPWTMKLLSVWLDKFDIHPTTLRIPGTSGTAKGYYRASFEAAWEACL